MIRSLYVAATGMTAMQDNVDTIANNLANVSTTGFKRDVINFEDLMYQTDTSAGAQTSAQGTMLPSSMQFGLGSTVGSKFKSFEQGSLEATPGITFNVALDGPGFFQVNLPDGRTAYTRDGGFELSSTGAIVNSMGYEILPSITLPDPHYTITISSTGMVQSDDGLNVTNVGQFELARFVNPSGLSAIGNNMYVATPASGDAVTGLAGDQGFGNVLQFYLENSNVNSLFEITALVKAQRAFEFNSKVMQVSEQILKTLVDTKA